MKTGMILLQGVVRSTGGYRLADVYRYWAFPNKTGAGKPLCIICDTACDSKDTNDDSGFMPVYCYVEHDWGYIPVLVADPEFVICHQSVLEHFLVLGSCLTPGNDPAIRSSIVTNIFFLHLFVMARKMIWTAGLPSQIISRSQASALMSLPSSLTSPVSGICIFAPRSA